MVLAFSFPASVVASATPDASIETPWARQMIAECVAQAPSVGRSFEGTVLQVIDGQTLCVAEGPTPVEWIRVTIAGAPQDSDRGTLMAASFGRVLDCLVVRTLPTGVEARCEVDGAGLEQLVATDTARRKGLSWR